MYEYYQSIPREPSDTKSHKLSEFGEYKVACLHHLMNYLTPHKRVPSDEAILLNCRACESLLSNLNPKLFEPNNISLNFPVWVYIAVHLRNNHTLANTGSVNGYISLFLVQRLQVELLRMVLQEILGYYGEDAFCKKIADKHDITEEMIDILDIDSTKVTLAMNYHMWCWMCLMADAFEPATIKRLLGMYISEEFISKSAVAEHLYTGGPDVSFGSNLDKYMSYLDNCYLVKYGVGMNSHENYSPDAPELYDTDFQSKFFLKHIIDEIEIWPN